MCRRGREVALIPKLISKSIADIYQFQTLIIFTALTFEQLAFDTNPLQSKESMASKSTVSPAEAMNKSKGPSLPRELQLSVMEHLVAQQCPVITLWNKNDLERIIAELIDVSDVHDKATDNIAIMVEAAIWSTAAIRPSFRLSSGEGAGNGEACIVADLPPGLIGFAGRIRHLELAIGMHLSAPSPPEPGSRDGIKNLWLATKAMYDIKRRFPALETFIVFLSVDATGFCDGEAKDGTWWELLRSVDTAPFLRSRTRTRDSSPPPEEPHATIRTWVSRLLEAANAHKVGKKNVFKLLVERDMGSHSKQSESSPGQFSLTPWLLRCDEINFSNENDMDSVVEKAWDSRRQEDYPKEQTENMLEDCAAPTLLIRTPYGAYGGH